MCVVRGVEVCGWRDGCGWWELQGMYSLGGFLVSMCAAVLLSLQMVQSERGWHVLCAYFEETSSTSQTTQRKWNRARLALHVMSSMTMSLPSLLPPGHVHVIVVCCV